MHLHLHLHLHLHYTIAPLVLLLQTLRISRGLVQSVMAGIGPSSLAASFRRLFKVPTRLLLRPRTNLVWSACSTCHFRMPYRPSATSLPPHPLACSPELFRSGYRA